MRDIDPAPAPPAALDVVTTQAPAVPARQRPDAGHEFSQVPLLQRQQSQTQAPPVPPGSMSRDDFVATMQRQYGVGSVHVGTMAEQVADLRRVDRPPADAPDTLPGWTSFDPGAASEIYQSISDAFEDFDARIGGVPAVDEILFFQLEYEWNRGAWTQKPDVGAKFGDGKLFVFSAVSRYKGIPIGRSEASGQYANAPGITLGQRAGETPGAPIPLPSRDESRRRIIAHELGHGLVEAGRREGPDDPATDRALMEDFRREVGWTAGGSPKLFDLADPTRRITPDDWNAPGLQEQPISRYAVEGGPGEDFAESVSAYVRAPEVLRLRSPARFRFIDVHRARWQRHLRQAPSPPGDYPLPTGDTRYA